MTTINTPEIEVRVEIPYLSPSADLEVINTNGNIYTYRLTWYGGVKPFMAEIRARIAFESIDPRYWSQYTYLKASQSDIMTNSIEFTIDHTSDIDLVKTYRTKYGWYVSLYVMGRVRDSADKYGKQEPQEAYGGPLYIH